MKIEFIKGDERYAPCIYWQTSKGQHYIFLKWFRTKHLFHRWSEWRSS